MPRDSQRKFYSRGGRGKLESELPCGTYIQHKSETKNTRPFKFKRLQKSTPICKNTFQGDQRNFSSNRNVKIFENLGKSYKRFKNPKHSRGLFHIDFVETLYQPRTPIRAKLNQVQEELLSQEVKEMLEKGAIRQTIHCKDEFVSHLLLVSKNDGG